VGGKKKKKKFSKPAVRKRGGLAKPSLRKSNFSRQKSSGQSAGTWLRPCLQREVEGFLTRAAQTSTSIVPVVVGPSQKTGSTFPIRLVSFRVVHPKTVPPQSFRLHSPSAAQKMLKTPKTEPPVPKGPRREEPAGTLGRGEGGPRGGGGKGTP